MKKINIPMLLTGMICSAVLCMILSVNVRADINSEESRVISVASGQFSYNGKQYTATSDSISQLVSRLDKDGTDLTEDQADEAIEKAYNSIGDGIAQGYLKEVGGGSSEPGNSSSSTSSSSAKSPGSPTNTNTSGTSAKTSTGTTTDSSSSAGTGTAAASAGTTATTAKSQAAAGTSSKTSASKSTSSSSSKSAGIASSKEKTAVSAASASSDTDLDKMLDQVTGLTKGQREAYAKEAAEKYGNTASGNASEDQEAIREKLQTGTDAVQDDGSTAIWGDVAESGTAGEIDTKALEERPAEENAKTCAVYDSANNTVVITHNDGSETKLSLSDAIPVRKVLTTFSYISWVSLIIILAAAVVLHRFKCMRYQKNGKESSDHKLRTEIRNTFSWIVTIIATADLTVMFLSAGAYTGMVTPSGISEAVNASGYYQFVYETMQAKVEDALLVCNIDQTKLNAVLPYDRFAFLSKQNTLDQLNGKTVKQDYSSLKNDIQTTLTADGTDETVVSTLTDEVMSIYSDSLKTSIMDYAVSTVRSTRSSLLMILLIGIIDIAAAIFLLLFGGHMMHRGWKKLAIAATAATAVLLILSIAVRASGFAEKTFISPEYLYILASRILKMTETMLSTVTVFAAVVSAALWGLMLYNRKASKT